MKKNKRFHVADNTTLDCPKVNYKYNKDSYDKNNSLFWKFSVVGLIISLFLIIFSNNSIIQTVSGAFLGGILSLIVWLLTIIHQDKMNYEIANIDMHIMEIEEHLDFQNSKVKFINPEDDELVQADSKLIVHRFMHLLQLCTNLYCDERINTEELQLRVLNNEECSLKEYLTICENICQNNFVELICYEKEWDKIIAWNNYFIDWKLQDLKKKLVRYKFYILCGNAPENYNDYKNI